MARLLRDKDYLRAIQADNLAQITEGNRQIMLDVEQSAQAEMASFISQRYLLPQIFTNTTVYSSSAVYGAKNLVEYTEDEYNPVISYLTGNRVSYNDKIYSSIAGSTPGVFNPSQWNYVVDDLSLFYVTLPYPEYNPLTSYVAGNKLWYNGLVYTVIQTVKNLQPDLFPAYYGTGVPYTVTNVLPTVGATWTQGDNRSQEIVMYLLDITLYHLHARINPRNIPDLRMRRYDGNQQVGVPTSSAIGWLKAVAAGDVTADLPKIIPTSGVSITWGDANGQFGGSGEDRPEYYSHGYWGRSSNLY